MRIFIICIILDPMLLDEAVYFLEAEGPTGIPEISSARVNSKHSRGDVEKQRNNTRRTKKNEKRNMRGSNGLSERRKNGSKERSRNPRRRTIKEKEEGSHTRNSKGLGLEITAA